MAVTGCGGRGDPTRTTGAPPASPTNPRALGLTRELPAAYRRVCAEQAERAPAGARLCPPLVPRGDVKVMYEGPFSKQREDRNGYLVDLASSSLRRLGDEQIETNGGHWHYDVSWSPTVRREAVRAVKQPTDAAVASACRQLRLGGERVQACRVVPYEQGGGLHGGHIAYLWSHGGTGYVVSVHGYANEPRARAMTRAFIAEVRGQ